MTYIMTLVWMMNAGWWGWCLRQFSEKPRTISHEHEIGTEVLKATERARFNAMFVGDWTAACSLTLHTPGKIDAHVLISIKGQGAEI